MTRLLLVAALLAAGLTGCTQTTTCVDWVHFETPADMADAADLVIVGEQVGRDGSTGRFGLDARAYMVRVDEVLKGELGDDEIRVLSLPATCSGGEYIAGDQLDVDGPVQLFLTRSEGEWQTLTSYQGVLSVSGSLPWVPEPTPAPSPTP